MNETMLTLGVTMLLIAVTVVPYVLRLRRKEAKARAKMAQMKISGLQAAAMVHPQIDAMQCIGCAACVRACPEGEVLGIIDGKAALVHGAKCIGHGLCAEACPVGAIELLMAAPGRSADLPVLTERYETTVPGMYIAGELGGLGLIKNAVRQGIAVVDHIAAAPVSTDDDVVDVAIIGAGPAGFAAALRAMEKGLRSVVLEQNDIGGTVLQYPRAKIVMTSPVELPLWGPVRLTETRKEALLELWNAVTVKTGMKVRTGEKVTQIDRDDRGFIVTSNGGTVRARHVVLALGRRGTPRKLGVPGESQAKVVYRLIDAASYTNAHVLVVGGGDSAVEAAVGLSSQPGNTVTLSYRKESFSRIKERNRSHIEEAEKRRQVVIEFSSDVLAIDVKTVTLKTATGEKVIPNDFVFVFAGGESPTDFLKKIGVEVHLQTVK